MFDFSVGKTIKELKADKYQNIDTNSVFNGVCIDSRLIKPGNLFIPIVGNRVNGHEFAVSVIKQGAVACLWQKSEPNPPKGIPLIFVDDNTEALQKLAKSYRKTLNTTIIGITGSSGKTSTKDITAEIVSAKYSTHKTQGNQNNEIGMPMTILSIDRSVQVAVIELGISDFKEMKLLTSIARPHIAIITSISQSHIDNLKTMDNIVKEKYRITEGLEKDGKLLYCGDYPLLFNYANANPLQQEMCSYGFNNHNDFRILDYQMTTTGLTFTTNLFDQKQFFVPLLGKHQLLNALVGMLCGVTLGLNAQEIQEGLSKIKLTALREEIKPIGESIIIDDTYNANPGSLVASLDVLVQYPVIGKKIAVIGDMFGLGEQSESLHRQIGIEYSFDKIEELWTIGNQANLINEEINKRELPIILKHFSDKPALIAALKQQCLENSLILVKASRGMALDEVVKNVEESFKHE